MTEGTENVETHEPVEVPENEMSPDSELEDARPDGEPAAAVDEVVPAADVIAPEPVEPEPAAPESVDEVDDVTAAIAEAHANVADEGSLDSIAPGTVAQDPDAALQTDAGVSVPQEGSVSWIPFLVYDLIWLIFAGLIIWQFSELPVTRAMYESDLYTLAVLGGAVLAAVGPLLIVAVWMGSWGKVGARKGPLLVSSLIRGSVATLVGVLLWWGALLLLDQLRLGKLL